MLWYEKHALLVFLVMVHQTNSNVPFYFLLRRQESRIKSNIEICIYVCARMIEGVAILCFEEEVGRFGLEMLKEVV